MQWLIRLTSILAFTVSCGQGSDNPDASTDAATNDSALDAAADGGTDASAESGLACDVVKQDCSAGHKCTIVDPTSTGNGANACIPISGDGGIDAACARDGGGNDDCAAGEFCTTVPGGAGAPLHCLKLCDVDSDCASLPNAVCTGYVFNPDMRGGFCVPTCTLFGSDCATGTVCIPAPDPDMTRMKPICRGTTINGDAGATCTNNTQCVAGTLCSIAWGGSVQNPGHCQTLCDSTHACTTGTCTPLTPPGPAGVGTCQ